MDSLSSFIPMDRRQALARGESLPDRTGGAALMADLAGSTALTETFATARGPQRGAEEITRMLNRVFDALIAEVDRYGGSVIGFSGDAMTCWFDADDGCRATTAATAMQAAMGEFAPLPLPTGGSVRLAVKVAVAAGPVRRFLVGDPAIRLIDALGGATLDRLAAAEHLAVAGDIILDPVAVAQLGDQITVREWREPISDAANSPADPKLALERSAGSETRNLPLSVAQGPKYAVLDRLHTLAMPQPWPPLPPDALSDDVVRRWLLPAVWERLRHGETFLAELRPTVALFLHFGGLDTDSPAAAEQLDRYVCCVQDTLARYEAGLIQLTIGEKGNFLYASFGAPLAHADEATRAAAAALELRTRPADCAYIEDVRIGLSGGRVWTGAYGGHTSRTFGALGDAVNLGARLMQHAPANGILGTRSVRQAAGPRFHWTGLPPIAAKGKADPVPVYELLGESTGRDLGLVEPRYAGPLVGRQAELAVLDQKLALVSAGQGQIIGITGEAGLGKSRLGAAAVERALAAGLVAYGGAAQSYGTQTPYLVWEGVWSAFFDLDPAAPPEVQIADLRDQLAMLDPRFADRLPLVGPLLNLPIPDTELTEPMDGALRKASLEGLLIDCLRARAAGQGMASGLPLLLVLEDTHWIDPLSQDLLDAIGRAIGGMPVLLLLAYRPPDAAGIAAGNSSPVGQLTHLPYFTELHLTQFTPAEAARLVEARLGITGNGSGMPPEVLSQLTTRAEGNPFYLEELLNYLLELGIDPHDPAALAGLDWPASLQSLLLARIDQLSEAQRTVLKVASVIGRRFLLAQLWGVYPQLGEAGAVQADLTVLDRLGLTPLDSPMPEWAYLFKHIVTRDVAYESLPYELRARLHEQFAAWLESVTATMSAPPLDLLAYHYSQSANTAKQREYLRKAADAGAATYALATARQYYERLLALLPSADQPAVLLALADVLAAAGAWDDAAMRYQQILDESGPSRPDTPASAQSAIRNQAALGLGMVRRSQGTYPEAERWLQQARTGFAAGGDFRGADRAWSELGRVYLLQARYDEARAALQDGLTGCRHAGDKLGEALTLNTLGEVASAQSDFPAARAFFEASLALQRTLGNKPAMATTLTNLGVLARDQGDSAEAMARMEGSLAISREIGARADIATALSNLGYVGWYRGELVKAQAQLEEGLALSRELGDLWGVAITLNFLGWVLLHQGETAPARALFEEALDVSSTMLGAKRGIAWASHSLGALLVVIEDYAEARQRLEEALALFRELVDKQGVVWALADLGVVAASTGDLPSGRALLEESLAGGRELADPFTAVRTLNMLGLVRLAQADYPAAGQALTESLTTERALGYHRLAIDTLVGLAGTALGPPTPDPRRAARLLGAIARRLTDLHAALEAFVRTAYAHTETTARAALGDEAFAAAFAEGQAYTPETVYAVALGEPIAAR